MKSINAMTIVSGETNTGELSFGEENFRFDRLCMGPMTHSLYSCISIPSAAAQILG